MGIWTRFWDWLTASATSAPKKGHPDLYPIDVAKLAKELRLVEEAKRLGDAKLPAIDAISLTGTEAQVVQRIEKARLDYTDWAVLRMQILSGDLAKRNVTSMVNRALQADKEFESRAGAILTGRESLLRGMGEDAIQRRTELESFKSSHGLTREAHPAIFGAPLRYALLVAGVLVEAVLNAQFFAQGLSSGLIGGFKFAAILAGLNIGAAFFIGKVLVRNIFHSNVFRKIFGLLIIIFSVSMVTTLGLGIAHMRDALTVEAIDAPKTALETLRGNPFGLRDIMSWVLFGISITFASLALLDGLFSDDLYPGYGTISRRAKLAIDDYESELDSLREQLEELKDEQLKALDEDVTKSQSSIAIFESLINDKGAASTRLSHALKDADNALEALLRKFRTENELHRGDAPRPKYFDDKPPLSPLPLPDFNTEADEILLKQQRDLLGELLNEVQRLRTSIQESFNRQFDRLKPLDAHFPNKGAL